MQAATLRYTDKRLGDDEKILGFASLFRQAKKEQKYYGFFPDAINGSLDPLVWEAFFNETREQRFVSERKIRFENIFYKFLDARLVRGYEAEANEYFYAIPRGFTKSEFVHLEGEYDEGGLLFTLKEKRFYFTRLTKFSEGIGLCTLTT